jgi:hypothetical protein
LAAALAVQAALLLLLLLAASPATAETTADSPSETFTVPASTYVFRGFELLSRHSGGGGVVMERGGSR